MLVVASIIAASCVAALSRGALFTTDDFDSYVYLDEEETVQFLFTVISDTYIDIGVISNNPGWTAIGISPNGQMPDSDIMFFWVDDSDSQVYLQDRYASSRTYPTLDESQDLTLIGGSQEDGVTYIRFIRSIYGCDDTENDLDFETGTSRILYAFNSEDPTIVEWDSDGGVTWHGSSNMGYKSVNVLAYVGDSDNTLPESSSYADIRIPENTIPDDSDTTYYCGLTKLPVTDDMQHIIAIEPLIKEGNEGVVHHMVAYHCPSSYVNDSHVGLNLECNEFSNMDIAISDCRSGTPIYSWAIGGESFYLPDHVGIEMSGNEATTDDTIAQYLVLEVHYDNPKLLSNIVDDSGLRFHYTPELRNQSASSFWSGMTTSDFWHFIPSGMSDVTNFGFCHSQCLESVLPESGVQIIASFLHAHTVSSGLKASIIRNNEEVMIIEENKNYDFNYQTTNLLSEEITLLPGDTIYVECKYDTEDRNFTTYGGEPSNYEMCLVSLMVWPKIDLGFCQSEWSIYATDGSQSTNFWGWYSEAINRGYTDSSSYKFIADGSDAAVAAYYTELWENSDYLDPMGHLCRSVFDTDVFLAPSPAVTKWYEYPNYCNDSVYSNYNLSNYINSIDGSVSDDNGGSDPASTEPGNTENDSGGNESGENGSGENDNGNESGNESGSDTGGNESGNDSGDESGSDSGSVEPGSGACGKWNLWDCVNRYLLIFLFGCFAIM